MIGRFLIVVTFFEDALRILTQWSDQLVYLREYRHSTLDHPQSSTLGFDQDQDNKYCILQDSS